MNTPQVKLLTTNPWPAITIAATENPTRSYIAVAYVGTGGAKLLPLRRGSMLVVDASRRAVSCGQTNPTDLLGLIKAGVRVYSVENLHAKVFVLGRLAFVGSTNVSTHSAE